MDTQATGNPNQVQDEALYQQGLANLQLGRWSEAQACFAQLEGSYPDNPQVQALLRETALRASVDKAREEEEAARAKRKRFPSGRKTKLLLLNLIMLLLIPVQVSLAHSTNTSASVANFNEQQLLRDAQAYLEAGDPAKAIAVYDQILAVLPNDTKAQEGLTKAQRQLQLDTLYHQASNRIQAKQWADAEKTLQELLAIDPKYKDAAKKLATVQQERKLAEQQNRLGSLFQEAQSYFEAGNWPMAARNYAAIFDADPSFEEAAIKDRLPKSLLNWANQLVASAGDSLLPYQQAIDLYDKALLVQPRDSQIVTARKLVTAYLDGYKLYGEGRWADAVEKLEPVYQLQTDYAGGRLAQLLYDAYIKNGDALAASRDDQAALDQYRKALALDVPDHSLAQSREHETSLRLAATGK